MAEAVQEVLWAQAGGSGGPPRGEGPQELSHVLERRLWDGFVDLVHIWVHIWPGRNRGLAIWMKGPEGVNHGGVRRIMDPVRHQELGGLSGGAFRQEGSDGGQRPGVRLGGAVISRKGWCGCFPFLTPGADHGDRWRGHFSEEVRKGFADGVDTALSAGLCGCPGAGLTPFGRWPQGESREQQQPVQSVPSPGRQETFHKTTEAAGKNRRLRLLGPGAGESPCSRGPR